jgi:hypothetical protein
MIYQVNNWTRLILLNAIEIIVLVDELLWMNYCG